MADESSVAEQTDDSAQGAGQVPVTEADIESKRLVLAALKAKETELLQVGQQSVHDEVLAEEARQLDVQIADQLAANVGHITPPGADSTDIAAAKRAMLLDVAREVADQKEATEKAQADAEDNGGTTEAQSSVDTQSPKPEPKPVAEPVPTPTGAPPDLPSPTEPPASGPVSEPVVSGSEAELPVVTASGVVPAAPAAESTSDKEGQ